MSHDSPPAYWLPAHVYACRVPGGAVMLDLRRNRYFGVGETEARVLQGHVANWEGIDTSADREEPLNETLASRILLALSQAQLLQSDPELNRPFAPAGIDLRGALGALDDGGAGEHIHGRELARFVQCCLWARYALYASSLYDIACALHPHGGRAADTLSRSSTDAARTQQLVRVFRRLRPYAFAAQDRCLFQALALVRFLQYHHVHARWVIGLRVRPWAAHSWVQQGHVLLDATPESVCEYTPIAAA